jgi:short-subunit dehydrogenase
MKRLQGRVAAITGAASGIGRATAQLLGSRGCSVALIDIDQAGLEETARDLQASGVTTSAHQADVSDAERMQALPAEVVAAHGAVHVIVNNAGVSVLKSFEDHTLDDLRWLIGINFWGVIHGCKFFLPELRKADEAHIVNVSSMFGFFGVPGQSSYCAAKFAVKGLSESLWAELQGSNIGVTSIHPGGIATGIAKTVRVDDEAARTRLEKTFEEHGHPPSDVAEGILRGIERNKLRVIVGREAYLTEWLKRLFPVSFHPWIAMRMNPNR